jgi:hypothetical protein
MRHVTHDMWHVTRETWHMTCDKWHLTCDTWHIGEDKHYLKISIPSSYCFWSMILWRFGGKGSLTEWMNESINQWRSCLENSPGYTGPVNEFNNQPLFHLAKILWTKEDRRLTRKCHSSSPVGRRPFWWNSTTWQNPRLGWTTLLPCWATFFGRIARLNC